MIANDPYYNQLTFEYCMIVFFQLELIFTLIYMLSRRFRKQIDSYEKSSLFFVQLNYKNPVLYNKQ